MLVTLITSVRSVLSQRRTSCNKSVDIFQQLVTTSRYRNAFASLATVCERQVCYKLSTGLLQVDCQFSIFSSSVAPGISYIYSLFTVTHHLLTIIFQSSCACVLVTYYQSTSLNYLIEKLNATVVKTCYPQACCKLFQHMTSCYKSDSGATHWLQLDETDKFVLCFCAYIFNCGMTLPTSKFSMTTCFLRRVYIAKCTCVCTRIFF